MSGIRSGPRARGIVAALALFGAARSARAAEPPSGQICIAAFHVATPPAGEPVANGPLMSATTWAPQADSVFAFRIDKRLDVTARNHERVLVPRLPVDRKIRVEVRLDGRPFETFALDLGKAVDQRVCLWLYPGYWHWIDNGWDPDLGCKCGADDAPEVR